MNSILSIILAGCLSTGLVTAPAAGAAAAAKSSPEGEVMPQWMATNTTGWLTDSRNKVRVRLTYTFTDGNPPVIYDVNGIAEYAVMDSRDSITRISVSSCTLSANKRSATVTLSYTLTGTSAGSYTSTVRFSM